MLSFIFDLTTGKPGRKPDIKLTIILLILFLCSFTSVSQEENTKTDKAISHGIIYRNPRVYNVDYTFELCPDRDSIDPSKDLKLWIPVPREWDSQKAVKIISIDPEPHTTYIEPEHGNKILCWDFGKEPVRDIYMVKIRYRVEVFEVYSKVDSETIESYDTKSDEYKLYTRSTFTANINPEIIKLTAKAVGNEKSPYLKAKRIFDYVVKHISFNNDKRRERGSSVESLLNYAVTNPETGEKHFQGQCDHYSILFVALCRAAGIPARGVTGMVGWGPWIREKDLKLRDMRHTLLTSEGLASTRLFGPFVGHIWAEFYLPGYGWIPVDPTWNRFGYQGNSKLILSKDRDIIIGPSATKMDDGVYGDQWIPLHNGRANTIGWGVWNISKIHVANAKILHTSDPFPADAYAEYATNLYPESDKEEQLRTWKKNLMRSFNNADKKNTDQNNIFETNPMLNAYRESYLCKLLHWIVGDEKFKRVFETYIDLRVSKGNPVLIEKFRQIAEEVCGTSLDFFFDEWIGRTSLPKLKLEDVKAEKKEKNWIIQGSLIQDGNMFHIPVELDLEMENERERKKIWIDSNTSKFEFITSDKPVKLTVDPDFHIPMIRWMPERLGMIMNSYPDLTLIYGTLAEGEENKKAAEWFNDHYYGLSLERIKPDTSVTESDLKAECVVIFGRPETNKIAQRFNKSFRIKFNNSNFTWEGTFYEQPTQGAVQIVENPLDHKKAIVLLAGLSWDATQEICDLSEWQVTKFNSSYVIYVKDKKYVSGDWEDIDSDLVWIF